MRRTDGRTCRILALLAATALRAVAVEAAIYNVGLDGTGAGCETSTLEAAVALAGATAADDEIRLVSGVQFIPAASILITDWSASTHGTLVIRGGYSSCTDTTADGARAQVNLVNALPGIRIRTTTAGDAIVTLENLLLYNSDGRALEVERNSLVELLDVELAFNDGGGLQVAEAGADVYLDAATVIHNNDAVATGGGIQCFNSGVVVESEAYVHHNSTDFDGGGIYTLGCEMIFGANARIEANEAPGEGGGIYAGGGALVGLFQGATVVGNTADGWGGGIAASDAGTDVLVIGARILANLSGSGGGGIYAANEVYVGIGGSSCNTFFCPTQIENNVLYGGARNGSAAVATDGGILRIKQSRVRGNEVPEAAGFGSVLYVDSDGELSIESVEIFGNLGANRVLQVASGGSVQAAFTTAARNRYRDAGNQLVEAYGLWAGGSGSEARIYSSIFHPTAGFFLDSGITGEIDCLITQSSFGLPGWATEFYVLDPGYRDLGVGDLAIGYASPAVDFCDSERFVPTVGGLDGKARSRDLRANPQGQPGPVSALSVQDLGAREVWEIFADGLEGKSTDAWSLAVP